MTIDPTKRCQVYRNLHTGTWSVRQSGKVVAHPTELILRDCRFHVQPAGRAKVRAEKKKNVHAYVSGFISNARESNSFSDLSYSTVKYNPYKMEGFQDKLGNVVRACDFVDMDCNDAFGDYVLAIWKNKL